MENSGKSGHAFDLEALEQALQQGRPEIFNSDQGVQFTSQEFTSRLAEAGVRINMDGRERVFDNIFIERLWRSVKYEEVYLHEYESEADWGAGLRRDFEFYNDERLHQALDYRTPDGSTRAKVGRRRNSRAGERRRVEKRVQATGAPRKRGSKHPDSRRPGSTLIFPFFCLDNGGHLIVYI